MRLPRLAATAAVAVFGCRPPAPAAPRGLGDVAWTAEGAAAGVARAGRHTFTTGRALSRLDDGAVAWRIDLPAEGGAVAVNAATVGVALGGRGALDGLPAGFRGEPGAAVMAVDARDGARRWLRGVGATEWAVVRAVAAHGDGFAIGGSFRGTLRIGDRVVRSAGDADGFWAVLGGDGAVRAVARMGGVGSDAVVGVVSLADGDLAIAGTYSGPAELDDLALPSIYPDPTPGDGFVAVLEASGRVRWARTWGSQRGEACAGVVATTDGVAIAATVREVVDVAGRRVDARGAGDGLVVYFDRTGAVRATVSIGGDDLDGVTAIAGHGDAVVIGGWFAGRLPTATGALVAEGGDDGYIAVVHPDGVGAITPVASPGPSAVRAIAADADGWSATLSSVEAASMAGRALAAGGGTVGGRW